MLCDPRCETYDVLIHDVAQVRHGEDIRRRRAEVGCTSRRRGYSYRMKLARETISLNPIEYRILCFLAAKPYRAYTRRRIADAVSSDRHPVLEETLDRHITTLRHKLGFFWHFIQTVPYIGYRFKA